MFDDVQRGWLDSDDYRIAAEAAGVVELPDGPESAESDPADPGGAEVGGVEPGGPVGEPPSYRESGPDPAEVHAVLGEVLTGRWTDDDPGSVGK